MMKAETAAAMRQIVADKIQHLAAVYAAVQNQAQKYTFY
jgi:hypothetical protein